MYPATPGAVGCRWSYSWEYKSFWPPPGPGLAQGLEVAYHDRMIPSLESVLVMPLGCEAGSVGIAGGCRALCGVAPSPEAPPVCRWALLRPVDGWPMATPFMTSSGGKPWPVSASGCDRPWRPPPWGPMWQLPKAFGPRSLRRTDPLGIQWGQMDGPWPLWLWLEGAWAGEAPRCPPTG